MVSATPTGSSGSSSADGKCRVTFELPPETGAKSVHVCGEFNDWSRTATPLAKRVDGRFSTTISLARGRRYQFRYLVDGERWENDWAADDYVPNEFGGEDSVVDLRRRPTEPRR